MKKGRKEGNEVMNKRKRRKRDRGEEIREKARAWMEKTNRKRGKNTNILESENWTFSINGNEE